MMMDVAGGVIIALAVSAVFAVGIYSLDNGRKYTGAFYVAASAMVAAWIVLS